ncbi:helix-turn-helix domain-containing protein, partial [Actinophytocola sp.]|uniref:helix-turn-helix domain-containing protein n=1 Tax=Actinophytocola sp. TaxID=1872138 RepID=UPI00389A7E96
MGNRYESAAYRELGGMLREVREKAGLSATELAHKLGWSTTTLSRIENGRRPSTTTDVIPLIDGRPVPAARTDPARLQSGELVYTGIRRTPVCALLGDLGAAEFFATTHDVYLILGMTPADPADRDTADGRPATLECAHARLARMVCGDAESVSP